ncbi:MAG: hypothetical protein WC573_13215 [Brevundimonas sp.]|uniref:hypothetical protein n=1 Tax=Brevundimonas sp. TaxID=1871086 RepID=UPI00356778CF
MSEAFVHSVCGQAWRGGGRLTPKPDALLAKGVELARDFDGRRIVAGAAVPGRQPAIRTGARLDRQMAEVRFLG